MRNTQFIFVIGALLWNCYLLGFNLATGELNSPISLLGLVGITLLGIADLMNFSKLQKEKYRKVCPDKF